MAGVIKTDPNTLHTLLHECIRHEEIASTASANVKLQTQSGTLF